MIPMCEVFDAYIVAIKSNADCTSVINISLLFTTAISVLFSFIMFIFINIPPVLQ